MQPRRIAQMWNVIRWQINKYINKQIINITIGYFITYTKAHYIM